MAEVNPDPAHQIMQERVQPLTTAMYDITSTYEAAARNHQWSGATEPVESLEINPTGVLNLEEGVGTVLPTQERRHGIINRTSPGGAISVWDMERQDTDWQAYYNAKNPYTHAGVIFNRYEQTCLNGVSSEKHALTMYSAIAQRLGRHTVWDEHVLSLLYADQIPTPEEKYFSLVNRTNVVAFDARNEYTTEVTPFNNDLVILPISQDPQVVTALGNATVAALREVDMLLAVDSSVKQLAERTSGSGIRIARTMYHDGVASHGVMKESIVTTAQSLAFMLYDEDVAIDGLSSSLCRIVRGNSLTLLAKKLHAGIIGPMAIRGLRPFANDVKNNDGTLNESWTGAIHDVHLQGRNKVKQRIADAIQSGDSDMAAIDRLFKTEHEPKPLDHLIGTGCPASRASIDFAARLVLRPFMPH